MCGLMVMSTASLSCSELCLHCSVSRTSIIGFKSSKANDGMRIVFQTCTRFFSSPFPLICTSKGNVDLSTRVLPVLFVLLYVFSNQSDTGMNHNVSEMLFHRESDLNDVGISPQRPFMATDGGLTTST